jgi:hypothetical protein
MSLLEYLDHLYEYIINLYLMLNIHDQELIYDDCLMNIAAINALRVRVMNRTIVS